MGLGLGVRVRVRVRVRARARARAGSSSELCAPRAEGGRWWAEGGRADGRGEGGDRWW